MSVINVDDDSLQTEVFQNEIPVVVEFSGSSGNKTGDVVDRLAEEYAGQVKFVRISMDNAEASAENFNVTSAPTVLFFKDSREVSRLSGSDTETGDLYRKAIAKLLH